MPHIYFAASSGTPVPMEDKDRDADESKSMEEERWTPSPGELQRILERHYSWVLRHREPFPDLPPDGNLREVTLDVDVSQRANLSNANLTEANLVGAHLEGAILSGAHLEEAHVWSAHLKEAVLIGAHLEGAILAGAHLEGAYLFHAHLERAQLWGADLEGAILWDAHLEEASLTNVLLKDASLQNADLTDVSGLHVRQLRGADLLNARLPEAIDKFEALSNVEDASQSAGKLLVTVLTACVYAAVAVVVPSESNLIELPIVSTSIPVAGFFLVTPALLALLYGYFHLQMQRMWEELAELPAIFPDGKPLDKKIHPWLVTDFVRAHLKHLKDDPPPFYTLQQWVVISLVWGAVPFTIGYIGFIYVLDAAHGPFWGSGIHSLLLGLAIWGGATFYRRAVETLRGHPYEEVPWTRARRKLRRRFSQAALYRTGREALQRIPSPSVETLRKKLPSTLSRSSEWFASVQQKPWIQWTRERLWKNERLWIAAVSLLIAVLIWLVLFKLVL